MKSFCLFLSQIKLGRHKSFDYISDRDCQQECEDFIEPVCTDTGMTYKSRCEFERYQCVTRDSTERIASNGACPGTSLGKKSYELALLTTGERNVLSDMNPKK